MPTWTSPVYRQARQVLSAEAPGEHLPNLDPAHWTLPDLPAPPTGRARLPGTFTGLLEFALTCERLLAEDPENSVLIRHTGRRPNSGRKEIAPGLWAAFVGRDPEASAGDLYLVPVLAALHAVRDGRLIDRRTWTLARDLVRRGYREGARIGREEPS